MTGNPQHMCGAWLRCECGHSELAGWKNIVCELTGWPQWRDEERKYIHALTDIP